MARQVPLSTFVPRGAIEWLEADPARRHQAVEGSLVFIDLSGFTALSERLARLGRRGAEEVTAVINTVFNGLLSVAYADGGSLLKFGGDALLLHYTGDRHAAHACRAAMRMQEHLRHLNPLGSSAGPVELRMTAGVHTGLVDQFLVGRQHRELVLTGPAVSAVVRAEGAAAAGEVLVTGATAALLPPDATHERPDGLHRLRSVPDAGPFLPPLLKDVPEEVDVGSLLSPAVHARLVQGVDDGEHRPAVTAFLHFGGTDDLLAEEGPEALAAALDELLVTVQEASERYGVSYLASDVDIDGGKLILLAGVPTAKEFDGEQMLRAVCDVARRDGRLPVQVGVHRGRVFAGVVGPHFRLTYTVIGDAVNVAARVMAHADAGQVLATAEVLNRSQVLFELEPVPPFRAKGKAQAVRAWVVGPVNARRLRPRQARLPLTGRDAEMADLTRRLDEATAGAGQVVVLAGEAGLGKSRLVDELQERRPTIPFHLAAAQRYERHTAYHLVGRLVRGLLGLDDRPTAEAVVEAVRARAPELVPWAALAGDALGVEVPDTRETAELQAAFRVERVAEVVAELVVRCVPGPAVLVLEDVHWLDQDSLRVLAHLSVAHLPDRPWLLLATARAAVRTPEGVPDPPTLELQPLPAAAVRELTLAAAEQGMVALDRVDRVAARSSGNPLFLEELVAGTDDEEDLPESLETLVQSRIDRLDATDRDRLRFAAVLGEEFDLELLAFVAGPGVAHEDGAWERLGAFLEPVGPGRFRFRHALVHDAAYAALPFRRRRELHERAAEGLLAWHPGTEDEVAELLALHCFNAGQWDRAWHYNRMAGDRARERHANASAAAHYRRAVEVAHHAGVAPAELAAVFQTLATVLEVAGSLAEATRALARARHVAPEQDTPRLYRLEGLLRERLGRYTQAVRWYRRGLRALQEHPDPVESAMLHAGLAIVRLHQGRPRDGVRLAEAALHDAEVVDEPSALARAHFVLAWAHDDLGDDRGERHRQRAIDLYEQLGDQRSLVFLHNNAGAADFHHGRWDEAIGHYEAAAEIAQRVGDRASHALLLGNIGEIRSNQGHLPEAAQDLTEGLGIARAAGHSMATAYTTMLLGRVAARRGEDEEAASRLTTACERLGALGARRLEGEARVHLAELDLFRGRPAAAAASASTMARDTDHPGWGVWGPTALRVWAAARLVEGDPDEADGLARESREVARRADDEYDAALAEVVIAHATEAPVPPGTLATLRSLGVVARPEALVFGPTADRGRAERASA